MIRRILILIITLSFLPMFSLELGSVRSISLNDIGYISSSGLEIDYWVKHFGQSKEFRNFRRLTGISADDLESFDDPLHNRIRINGAEYYLGSFILCRKGNASNLRKADFYVLFNVIYYLEESS